MKWQLVLKVESKDGDVEEHVIGKEWGARQALGILFQNVSSSPYCSYLLPGQQKHMLENTQEMNLVGIILDKTNMDITEKMLDDLLKRFSGYAYEFVEEAVLDYCWRNKKGLYKKFAKKCKTPKALSYIPSRDSLTKNDT